MEHIYLERVLDNALQLEGEWDFVVIHDPQPAAMREYAAQQGRRGREHEVDLALPHRPHRRQPDRCWKFFRPFVEQYDASVWTMPQFVPDVDAAWTASCSRRRASIRCR